MSVLIKKLITEEGIKIIINLCAKPIDTDNTSLTKYRKWNN